MQATVTCQASPAKTSAPSQRTRQRTGSAREPGAQRADRVGERSERRLSPCALRAATGESPALAALTNGAVRSIRPRSRRAGARARQRRARPPPRGPRGSSSARAKSLAVPDRDHARAARRPARRPRPRSRSSRRRRRRRSAPAADAPRPAPRCRGRSARPRRPRPREQPLDLLRLARPGVRVGEQRDHASSSGRHLASGPRGPSAALLLAALRDVSNGFSASSPAFRAARGGALAGCRGSCRRPSAATTSARGKQEREDREDDADGDDDRDGHGGLLP